MVEGIETMSSDPCFLSAVDQFCRTGKTHVPVDVNNQAEILYRYFRDVLVELPRDQKDGLTVDLSPNKRPDHGHFRREDMKIDSMTGKEVRGDWKDCHHFRPWDEENDLLRIYHDRNIRIPVGLSDWYENTRDLMTTLLNQAGDFLSQIDSRLQSGTTLASAIRDPSAMSQHVVRFLCYDPKPEGEELADEHCDFSLATWEILSTARGLWTCPKGGNDREFVEVTPGHSFIFAGRKMPVATGGLIQSVNHGVVARNHPLNSDNNRRGAIVFFIHGPGEKGPSCPS